MVADAEPLGVTTATVTVCAARLRRRQPGSREGAMSGPATPAPATSAVTAVPVTAPEPCRPGLRRACPGAPGAVTVDRSRLRPASLLIGFSLAAVGAGTARGLTTTYLPVLLERINDAPILIGAVLTLNAVAGLVVPFAVGAWSDRREDTRLGRRLPFMVGGTVLGRHGLGCDRGRQRQLIHGPGFGRRARVHGPERAHDAAPGTGR